MQNTKCDIPGWTPTWVAETSQQHNWLLGMMSMISDTPRNMAWMCLKHGLVREHFCLTLRTLWDRRSGWPLSKNIRIWRTGNQTKKSTFLQIGPLNNEDNNSHHPSFLHEVINSIFCSRCFDSETPWWHKWHTVCFKWRKAVFDVLWAKLF